MKAWYDKTINSVELPSIGRIDVDMAPGATGRIHILLNDKLHDKLLYSKMSSFLEVLTKIMDEVTFELRKVKP